MHVGWTLCQACTPLTWIDQQRAPPCTYSMHAPLSPEQTSKDCTYSMHAPLSPEQTSRDPHPVHTACMHPSHLNRPAKSPTLYIQHACTPLTWTDQQRAPPCTYSMHAPPSHLNRPAKSPTLQLQWEPLATNPSRDAAWSSRYEKRDDSVRSIHFSNSYLDM